MMRADPAPSPCRGTCRYDEAAEMCRDCGRLGREIAGWGSATQAERLAIRIAAAARLDARAAAALLEARAATLRREAETPAEG